MKTMKDIIYVDGFKIRMHLDLEFSLCYERSLDYNYYSPKFYIPENEIWIDHLFKDETDLLVRLETEPVPGATAWDRRESRKKKFLKPGPAPEFSARKDQHMGYVVVYVRGDIVRQYLDPEFVQGGHEFVYDYVPKGEIWVDDKHDEAEKKYILEHEAVERTHMGKGMKYDEAHERALVEERVMRRKDGACWPGDASYLTFPLSDYRIG